MTPLRCTLLLGVVAVSCLASGQPAGAASFACVRATSAVETAICSNPGLSRLDERLERAYAAAIRPFRRSYVPEEYAASLKESQRTWIIERDRCGTGVPCLRRQYERRLSILSFGPDPDAPGPVDRFVGRFTDGYEAEVPRLLPPNVRRTQPYAAVLRLGPDRAIVALIDDPGPEAQWICEFSGIGEVQGDGSQLVARTSDGEAGYTLRVSPRGLELTDNSGGGWCGFGGAIASPLRRVH